MRVIDADALGNRMYHEAFEKDSDLQKWDSGCWIRYKLFENVLKETPTIDPVKHGKWIEDAKTYYEQLNERGNMVDEYTPYFSDDIACSECLAKYSVIDNETQFFKYCPNCGARMDGE